jgi:hypothetical protein
MANHAVECHAAGWLMGILAWLVLARHETVSQVIAVTLISFVIGIAGFHHLLGWIPTTPQTAGVPS